MNSRFFFWHTKFLGAVLVLLSFSGPAQSADMTPARSSGAPGLELLVSPDSGDILVVKPAGSPWGTEETKHFFVLRVDEPELNALTNTVLKGELQRLATQLDASGRAGEPHPVVAYPFAQYAEKTVQVNGSAPIRKHRRMVQQSRWRVEVNAMDPQGRLGLSNPSVDKPVLGIDSRRLATALSVRPDPQLEAGEVLVNQEEAF